MTTIPRALVERLAELQTKRSLRHRITRLTDPRSSRMPAPVRAEAMSSTEGTESFGV